MKILRYLMVLGTVMYALPPQSGKARAQDASPPAGQTPVTAIDILLEPDATMVSTRKP